MILKENPLITVERAKIEDAAALVKVKVSSFSREATLYGSGPPGYDSLENQMQGIKHGYCYKIVSNDRIIGGMGVYDKGNGHFRIGSIYIDLDFQNQGIGTLAMKFIGREFPRVTKWSLETPYLSYMNHHFYEKLGFVKVGATEPESDRNGFYLFLYEKMIS